MKDPKCRDHYETFMKVPSKELSLNNGCIWYIPHHGVYQPQKPDKMSDLRR